MLKRFLPILLLSFASALAGGWTVHMLQSTGHEPDSPPAPSPAVSLVPAPVHVASPVPLHPNSPAPSASGALPDFRMASHRALDAVVHVRTVERTPASHGWYDWSGFFRPDPRTQGIRQGSGSGVILDGEGYIVTNHHVVEGAELIEVGLNDNRSFPATLIGSDPSTDIAVLRIDATGLDHLDWGDSDELKVGDWVLAVGNPFDLTSTVTAGIVSAKARNIQLLDPDHDRSLPPVESFIQTDAAVNPGNSGGALVDVSGRLMGINTAIASRTGSYAGYSFAVPANLAAKVARDLIEFGAVQRAYLGVTIRPVDEEVAGSLALPAVSGVLVTGVVEGGAAGMAGIAPGDVILSVGGKPTGTMPELLEGVNRYRPGERTTVELWRDGSSLALELELGTREGSVSGAPSSPPRAREEDLVTVFGCSIRNVRVDGNGGKQDAVEIVEPGIGPFMKAGIKAGTLIQSVDGVPTPDLDAFLDAMDAATRDDRRGILLEGLDPDGNPVWYGLDVD